jgi:hypothetical protein
MKWKSQVSIRIQKTATAIRVLLQEAVSQMGSFTGNKATASQWHAPLFSGDGPSKLDNATRDNFFGTCLYVHDPNLRKRTMHFSTPDSSTQSRPHECRPVATNPTKIWCRHDVRAITLVEEDYLNLCISHRGCSHISSFMIPLWCFQPNPGTKHPSTSDLVTCSHWFLPDQ